MKSTLQKIMIPALIILIVLLFIFFQENNTFTAVFSGVILLLLVNTYIQIFLYRKKDQKISWLSKKLNDTINIVEKKETATELISHELPLGILVYDNSFYIKWANQYAKDIFENVLINRSIETLNTPVYELVSSKKEESLITKIYSNEYEIKKDSVNRILYINKVTEREETKRKYLANTNVIAVLNLDNLDDALSVLDVSERNYILGKYLQSLESWAEENEFYLTPVTNSKLVALLTREELDQLINDDFSIVDKISRISADNDLLVTLSGGFACANIELHKLGDIADDALDLALSRGGDQIVVNIEGNELLYFGGNTNTAEKRTRITTRINTQKLARLFKETKKTFVVSHKHPDTDAFGAAMGILKLAQAFDKDAYIVLNKTDIDKSVKKILQLIEFEYITLLERIISVNDALDMMTREDLLILIDHHSYGQTLEEKFIAKTKNLVIIDHHRKLSDAITGALISHMEPYASSSVELVTEMINLASEEVDLNAFEATVMLSGMTVDTNNFMYRTGARTFEAAAILRNFGADTFKVKTILREGLDEIQLKSKLLANAEVISKKFSIVIIPDTIPTTRALLAKVADMLLEIEDIIAAFAIGRINDDTIGISARSLEKFNVQVLMEKFGGGGHLNNAGAQIENITKEDARVEVIKLLNDAVQEERPMKVILIKDLKGKGKKGDIIEVAAGYGNFLLNNKTAIEATNENVQSIESEKAKKQEEERKLLEEMKELKTTIEALPVKVFVKIGENGKLFGKINSKQIADEFKKQHKIILDKRKVQLKENISSLGNYKVEVKLHKDVTAIIEVLVIEE